MSGVHVRARQHALEQQRAAHCFAFIDFGANVGDSIMKVAHRERYPASGLARAVASLVATNASCRRILALEANPAFARELGDACRDASAAGFTCTALSAAVHSHAHYAEFFIDVSSRPGIVLVN